MTGPVFVEGTEDGLRGAAAALVRYGRKMADDGLCVGSAGNLSVRLGDRVAITPSGVTYEAMVESQVCLLALDGRLLDGRGTPSSEWPLHQRIYRSTAAGAVVHTHSPFATAVSTVCRELPAVHYSILRLGCDAVRVAPYQTFGSDGLAQAVGDTLGPAHAVLLQNHGAVTVGATLEEAYFRATLLEWLAGVFVRARALGEPRVLGADELRDVEEAARRRRDDEAGST